MTGRISFFRFIFFVYISITLIQFLLFGSDVGDQVLKTKNTIKGQMILSHIEFLASKYCRGRETGTYGMEVAIKYIESILKGAGLEPAGEYGDFKQMVELKKISLSDDIYMEIEDRLYHIKKVKKAHLEWDFLPIYISAEQEVSAPLVFAGYGITAPEHRYDDYQNIDAKGKIVLVLRYEPREKDNSSPFEGRKLSKHGTLLSKILNAQRHGAVGILFATGPLLHEERSPGMTRGTYWPSLYQRQLKSDEDYKYMRFTKKMRIVGDHFGVRIPAVAIDGKLADELIGETRNLKKIQKKIDLQLKPQSFFIPLKRISMGVFFKSEPADAFNLVAKIEGSDPKLKQEVVIVGAHYDHMGKDNRGRVYGGADDNASGTAGVIELARAFQQLEKKPKRTLLFILFTAEEKGLLGARFYISHPLFPLEKTLAMINLDMIGRNDINQISLIGRYQYPGLFKIISWANRHSVNMEINFSVEEWVRNSDHFPFMRNKIPSLFFNSGSHEQLHRPEDTPRRLIPEKMEKVVQMIFLALWKTANLPQDIRLTNEEIELGRLP